MWPPQYVMPSRIQSDGKERLHRRAGAASSLPSAAHMPGSLLRLPVFQYFSG